MRFDGAGNMHVNDRGNTRIVRYAPLSVTGDLALGQLDFVANVGATTATGLNGPVGLCVHTTGVYVADAYVFCSHCFLVHV